MPKTLVVSHVLLLACLSVLACSVVKLGDSVAQWLAIVAVCLAGIMAITEFASGLRWPALVALVATIVGLAGRDVTGVYPLSWVIAWCAVTTWFAVLAARSRSDR